jgi:hypothetical protein
MESSTQYASTKSGQRYLHRDQIQFSSSGDIQDLDVRHNASHTPYQRLDLDILSRMIQPYFLLFTTYHHTPTRPHE